MQKELNFTYNELITLFEWSYSPYTKMWYEDVTYDKDKTKCTFKNIHGLNRMKK